MLIALFIATFILVGGGMESLSIPEDFEQKVEAAVTDDNRREEIRGIVENAAGEMKEINDRIHAIVQKSRQLNLNYTATEAEFKPFIAELMQEQKNAQREIMGLHFQLRNKITEEEWGLIFTNAGADSSEP